MDESNIKSLLEKVAQGEVAPDQALEELRFLPYADLGFAKVDHHREIRSKIAETVFAPGKTPSQVAAIAAELAEHGRGAVLITRADKAQWDAVYTRLPESAYFEQSGVIVVRRASEPIDGVVLVASAGTADQIVAGEAVAVGDALGLKIEELHDVGVAGLHRLLSNQDAIQRADVIIAVAGMEGALASLVAGLASAPVIAVPTSVNYGAGASGIAPMLAMLNSCAPGVAVVNIDNGFGAAVLAAKILSSRH